MWKIDDYTSQIVPEDHCSQQGKVSTFFENMTVIAEIALTLPVSNASPERGASAIQ